MAPFSLLNRRSNSPLSPLEVRSSLLARSPAEPNPQYTPGGGTFDPAQINNKGIFALFALIGATFVLAAIWFFFWAKNGGFHWRKGDWDDYKSTVLRRKGPNGTTLSGATKTTELGGGSVVADAEKDYEDEAVYWEKANKNGGKGTKAGAGGGRKSKQPRGSKNNNDDDVRAYRHEKPAKVGGLNREADGAYHHDFAYSTDPSEASERNYRHISSSINNRAPAASTSKPAANPHTPLKKSKASDKSFYTHSPSSTSSHRPLRPNGAASSGQSTPTRSRQSSPRKYNGNRWDGSMPGTYNTYTEPLDYESRYSATASEAGQTEDSRGTKAYFHPIPGLGAGGGSAGHGYGGGAGYAAGRSAGTGFRRGGGGRRRDSLSDSEGETEMS